MPTYQDFVSVILNLFADVSLVLPIFFFILIIGALLKPRNDK
jgi:hypothetical protein